MLPFFHSCEVYTHVFLFPNRRPIERPIFRICEICQSWGGAAPPNTPPPYGPASYEQNLSLSTAVLEIKFGKKLHALKTRCKQTRPVAHTMLCAQNMRRRDLTFTLILRSLLYSSLWQNTSCIYHYCGW